MKKIFPILDWLPNYQKRFWKGDLTAGITVGVLLIPQGMAYAMIAGLPPVYGLYAALFPQIIYTIFGTSRQLSVGPVAMDSLLVASAIGTMAVAGTDHYITIVLLLSTIMGVILLIFGLLRFGFLVNFLSKPVINGFTTAAAIVIGLNQLKLLFGLPMAAENNFFLLMYDFFTKIYLTHWPTLILGLACIIVLKNIKKLHVAIPGQILVVIIGIVVSIFFKDQANSWKVVGEIPSGFPSFQIPEWNWELIKELAPFSLTIALVAYMEAISVAKAIESKNGTRTLNPNQEMIAIGAANIFGSFFGSYSVTGGFSRTAVNDQSGANTNLSSLISAVLVGLTLLFFTSWFYYLPHAVLGAVILVAVSGLIDLKFPIFLWKTNKHDFYMLALTFCITLSLGIKEGLISGVLLSIMLMIYRTSKPHIAVLGKLPGTTEYRNVARFKEIETREDVLFIRFDAQLYFVNINYFKDGIMEKLIPETKLVILDCGAISHIDSTALQTLLELTNDLERKSIKLYFSSIIGPVRDYLTQSGFVKSVGKEKFFIDVESALMVYEQGRLDPPIIQLNAALQSNVFNENI